MISCSQSHLVTPLKIPLKKPHLESLQKADFIYEQCIQNQPASHSNDCKDDVTQPQSTIGIAKAVIHAEIQALYELLDVIDDELEQTVQLIHHGIGRVIVLGVGKSGHIGRKIAATLASTGTPAFFVHAAEASHGDLGMITTADVVIAISYSGNTPEMVSIIPTILDLGATLVAITGNRHSTLAMYADITLDLGVREEADPLGIVPTSSTTATLALGDAIAIALSVAKNFSREDFGRYHPGGSLGRLLASEQLT